MEAESIAKFPACQEQKSPRASRIGVARDEAFCFYYQENFHLLEQMGAELVYFSPLRDKKIPDRVDGLLFGGGYPENYARELAKNAAMREYPAVDCGGNAVSGGMWWVFIFTPYS